MKFNSKKFNNALQQVYRLVKRRFPETKNWTAYVHLWEDGDFDIEMIHNEPKSVYYHKRIFNINWKKKKK